MRIVGASGPANGSTSGASRERHNPEAPETDAHSLIAVEATVASERATQVTRHPGAAFLAHLIATRMHAPQTRARRRVEPEEAMAVYSTGRMPRTAIGRMLRRTS